MSLDRQSAVGPLARELVVIAVAVIAVVLPFVNGILAGPPAPSASIDLRYVLVVGGATLGLLGVVAWRASMRPVFARRAHIAAVTLALLPLLLALQSPHDPLWVSLITLELLLGSLLVAGGAAFRLARAPGPNRPQRIAAAITIVLVLLGPWATLTWGLTQMQLGIAPVRLAHQEPLRTVGEEEVEIPSADGTLLRGTYTAGRRGAGGVVIVHGIADGRTRMAGWSAALSKRGYHALRFDWRAHGVSEGSVTTFADRERDDLDAAFEWLATQPGVDRSKMAILGTSMGAGIALASTRRLVPRGLRAIVAFAPPSDYEQIVGRRVDGLGPISPVVRTIIGGVAHGLGHVSPLELLPGRELELGPPIPVLLFHGDADETIPLEQSQQLYERVPSVELHVLPGVTHDEIPATVLNDVAARRRVLIFLRRPRTRRDAEAAGVEEDTTEDAE
ncbi:MAG: lysophospholipase [Myxococcota bacterium]|nr:lysophospholipase [Myxococcota bacterium]